MDDIADLLRHVFQTENRITFPHFRFRLGRHRSRGCQSSGTRRRSASSASMAGSRSAWPIIAERTAAQLSSAWKRPTARPLIPKMFAAPAKAAKSNLSAWRMEKLPPASSQQSRRLPQSCRRTWRAAGRRRRRDAGRRFLSTWTSSAWTSASAARRKPSARLRAWRRSP